MKLRAFVSIPPVKTWILSAGRLGDLKLMESVAQELGWPFEIKSLRFRRGSNFLRTVIPGKMLQEPPRDPFSQATPGLVICAESATAALAAAAKKNGADFKLVSLSRPRRDLGLFDLIISPPQYPLPDRPNIRRIPASPHVLPELVVAARQLREIAGISALLHPLTGVLVGGTSMPDQLNVAAARALCEALRQRLDRTGGGALCITSPRTGKAVEHELARRLPPRAVLLRWDPKARSHFGGVLGLADEFVVTSDSVSMTIEAMLTAKPVYLFDLPKQPTIEDRLLNVIQHKSIMQPLFNSGFLMRRATRRQMFEALMADYNLKWFTASVGPSSNPPLASTAPMAASMIKSLFA